MTGALEEGGEGGVAPPPPLNLGQRASTSAASARSKRLLISCTRFIATPASAKATWSGPLSGASPATDPTPTTSPHSAPSARPTKAIRSVSFFLHAASINSHKLGGTRETTDRRWANTRICKRRKVATELEPNKSLPFEWALGEIYDTGR